MWKGENNSVTWTGVRVSGWLWKGMRGFSEDRAGPVPGWGRHWDLRYKMLANSRQLEAREGSASLPPQGSRPGMEGWVSPEGPMGMEHRGS